MATAAVSPLFHDVSKQQLMTTTMMMMKNTETSSNNVVDNNHLTTYEIFSILENKFLFGCQNPPSISPSPSPGKVRLLTIDAAGSTHGLLAASSLLHLQATIRRKSGHPHAHIADYFDLVAGSGAGGLLAALLFTRGKDGVPLFTAEQALDFIANNHRLLYQSAPPGLFRLRLFRPSNADKMLKKLFGESTLKDTLKSVLIPCYDLSTGGPFVFSRADALEIEGCDFKMSDVCRATIASGAVELKSTDGRRKIVAVGGGVSMNNPTAAAITHVLNNKQEFPFCKGVEDLVVVSLGNGDSSSDAAAYLRMSSKAAFLGIAGDEAADMVDEAVAMAFGEWRSSNYVRIQGNGIMMGNSGSFTEKRKIKGMLEKKKMAEEMLRQKNVESVMFEGKKLGNNTNMDKLEIFGGEIIKEQEKRKTSILSPVIFKSSSPRTSSATTLSTQSSN